MEMTLRRAKANVIDRSNAVQRPMTMTFWLPNLSHYSAA